MNVNVMVLSWEKFSDTKKCIESVANEKLRLSSNGYKTKIIVVDNGSNKDMQYYLCEQKALGNIDVLILNEKNMGISIARNQAIENIDKHAEYVIMLDGDIKPVENSFVAMVKYMESNNYGSNKIGCLGAASYQYAPREENATKFIEKIEKVDEGQQLGGVSGEPIAWTQFGIFAGELFTKHNLTFITEGVFGMPGYGFEDDLFALSILKRKYIILRFTDIYYFHKLDPSMTHDGSLSMKERRIEERRALAQAIINEGRVI